MRKNFKVATLLVALLLMMVACVKEPTMSATEIEQRSLKAWIEKYHSDIVDNYQQDGGYYVRILDYGVQDSLPISGKDVWVWYDFTGRDLDGNICETRDGDYAQQIGTFTKFTRYVPAYRFSGALSTTMMEGSYLATFNKLKIGQDSIEVRYGTEMILYLPSAIIAATESSDGGYEGEYELDATKPLAVHMKIYGHVANPVAYEGDWVDAFANANGGLCTDHRVVKEEDDDDKGAKALRRRTTRGDETTEEEVDTRPLEFYDGRWHQPVDTLVHLYVNYSYNPEKSLNYDVQSVKKMYDKQFDYRQGEYASGDIDSRVNEALIERFGKGITTDEVLTTDSLNTKTTAKVWYVGRFLDGFIFDTNIDEVKEIIHGEVQSKGTALSFTMSDPELNDYILSWLYAIPTLRVGQWAAVLSVSTYGYGFAGQVGSHTSTTTSDDTAYYDYINYMNYMNAMNNIYGYGYGSAYNYGYYGYDPYYYGYGYTSSGGSTSTTVTTTSTEIPAYSPLLFQIFVE